LATRKYKPYTTRKQQKSRSIRNVAFVLIGLIVAVVIINKFYGDNGSEPDLANGPATVNGAETPATPEATETRRESGPVEISTRSLIPEEPAPTPQPEAVAETTAPQPAAEPEPVAPQPPVVTETPSAESSEQATQLVNKAMTLRDAGKIIEARELLNAALDEQLSATLRAEVKGQLSKLAEKWLFSSDVYPGDTLTSYYLVQKGDHLEQIAKQYKIPYEILMKINGISRPELLRADQKIKVLHGPFNVDVHKDSFTMDLFLQDKYIKTYHVGLGRVGHETPSGRWRVKSDGKSDDRPTWTDPDTGKTYLGSDPDYPLGDRWIAIEGLDENTRPRTGFAIHGTKDPESIGTRSSRGCIRMHNKDVIEIYNLLYGGASEVHIKD